MTSDRVIIPLPGLGTLDLPRDVFERHLVRPEPINPERRELVPSELVNAKMLARELSLPLSCIYEYAKAKRIPSVRIGRHVRFDRRQVRAALDATGSVSVGHA